MADVNNIKLSPEQMEAKAAELIPDVRSSTKWFLR